MTGSYNALCPFLPVKSVCLFVWRSFALSKGSLSMFECISIFMILSDLWGLLSMETILSYQVPVSLAADVRFLLPTFQFPVFQCNQSLELKPNPIEPIRPLVPGPFPVIHPR